MIAKWGNSRAYRVLDVIFDKNPFTLVFTSVHGEPTTLADYMLKTYDVKVTVKEQPLFVTKMSGNDIFLPTEFCCFDGLPDDIRCNKMKMRSILKSCQKNPDEKFHEIEKFSHDLFA